MARPCSICSHEDREEIDRRLLSGAEQIGISQSWALSQSAVSRHLRQHLRPELANRLARYQDVDAERLRAWSTGILEEALAGALVARRGGDTAGHRGYLGEARKAIELVARLAGVLDGPTHLTIDARQQLAILSNLSESELRAALAGMATRPELSAARSVIELEPATP